MSPEEIVEYALTLIEAKAKAKAEAEAAEAKASAASTKASPIGEVLKIIQEAGGDLRVARPRLLGYCGRMKIHPSVIGL